jgi:hypothetical protein
MLIAVVCSRQEFKKKEAKKRAQNVFLLLIILNNFLIAQNLGLKLILDFK